MTVSANYAFEITTPEGGCGLESVLCSRKGKLDGVVNGIDLNEWNPRSDEYLPAHYSIADLSGKAACKAALQKELGLPVRPDVPLIGFIGRLDWQKGPELIRDAIPALMGQDVQLVMLGAGRWDLQEFLKATENYNRDKFRGWVGFSVAVSHRITAGADILLMPSKFEPCGLNQLYAMRYGTVPVVHATGGLIDTVKPYSDSAAPDDDAIGTGFLFSPANSDAMMGALNAAMRLYREKPERWRALMRAGMRRDSSWLAVAARYEQIFEWAKLGASIGNALPLLACAYACAFPFAPRRPAVLRLGRAPAGCCIGV
jgi:starch synthase